MEAMKSMLASWARSFVAACLTVYLAGITDPKAIAYAGLSAIAPVILRWLNPEDKDFGIGKK